MSYVTDQAASWGVMREKWAGNESVNGPGSTMELTKAVRAELPRIFSQYGIKTMLDVPCGDWAWFQHVDLSGVNYMGWDVVPELIESNQQYERQNVRFVCVNALTVDRFPKVDLILMRDFLFHLTTIPVERMIDIAAASGSRYLLATHNPGAANITRDMGYGDSGIAGYCALALDLEKPPFMLEPALENIVETGEAAGYCDGGVKRVGMCNHTLSLYDLHSDGGPPLAL